nr:MAG TPA: hypothetical protein [Caudoviricetes sp.]
MLSMNWIQQGYRGKYVRPITDLKQPSEASR